MKALPGAHFPTHPPCALPFNYADTLEVMPTLEAAAARPSSTPIRRVHRLRPTPFASPAHCVDVSTDDMLLALLRISGARGGTHAIVHGRIRRGR